MRDATTTDVSPPRVPMFCEHLSPDQLCSDCNRLGVQAAEQRGIAKGRIEGMMEVAALASVEVVLLYELGRPRNAWYAGQDALRAAIRKLIEEEAKP